KANNYKSGSALYVRDPRSRYKGIPTYTLDQFPSSGLIWDITNPQKPILQQFQQGNQTSFSVHNANPNQPEEFICFNPASDVFTPDYVGAVQNQNLHALQRADMLIVYFDDFEEAALKLAQHRRDFSHLVVECIPVSKVFKEFGGGSKDPAALRDFARMVYKRDPLFKYLLLIGDASYDFLNHSPDVPFQNFIPAFETEESLDPIRSFPTDDFFALLDNDEGNNLTGALDIAVGRFPVSSEQEAMDIVNKIIYYETNPLTLADWRNRLVFVADDEDANTHLKQADAVAVSSNTAHPVFNEEKIYLDAYPQQSTPGGDRYPAVNDDIDLNMKKGALTVTYLGHGGPNGWTQERVLGVNQAQSYDNLENMPLFITATCSFAGYDEPGFTSTGEHLLVNPNGGAIGLMTTVRAVFSGSNSRLTDAVHDIIFTPDADGNYLAVGEVLRRSKNANGIDTVDTNARKFTMLGDPALKLAIPRYNVAVKTLQGQPVGGANMDTLSALESAVVTGTIENNQGQLITSFNGTISLTLFDKIQVRKTLANDP
ncbi:MAG TPA: type IX secretion system sortase PorU, partial [Saprospiraceae bacterium]|nr:type IX secretion system sortase PorU [Saprospiraceae bacterium]